MEPHDESLRFFREHEYAVLPGFYPRSLIDDYRAFLGDALEREVWPLYERLGLSPVAPDLAARVGDLIAGPNGPDSSVRQVLLGQFPLAVRLSNAIHPIARHVGKSRLLQSICESSRLFMHMPPMARFVPPHYSPAAVPAHQDLSYNTHMTDFVTVWTPLVDIDAECGGLIVHEGSHRHRETVGEGPGGWLGAVDASAYPAKKLTGLGPGDAVLLSTRIVHASAPNVSNHLRLSLDLRVFGAMAKSTKHFMDLATLETIAPSEGA